MFEQKYKGNIMKKFVDSHPANGIHNVNDYKQVVWDMYQDAELAIKTACKEAAEASNDSRNEKPPTAQIFV